MNVPIEILLPIIIFVSVFLVAYIVLSLIFLGSVWGYELTPEQISDEQKTKFCIVYNISNEECFQVYGGTDWEPEHK